MMDQLKGLLEEYAAIKRDTEEQCLHCFGRCKSDVLKEIGAEIEELEDAINTERRWYLEEEDLAYCRPRYQFLAP